jgi:hypothetical protein
MDGTTPGTPGTPETPATPPAPPATQAAGLQFQTASQEECYNKVKTWIKEIFGDFATPREDSPSFAVYVGSSYSSVSVMPWGEDDAVVTTRSWIVTGVEMTQELLYFLLRENDTMRFGAFGLDSDNDVFFEHTIVGSTADKVELKASVMAVVMTADRYDDQISSRWGGTRAIDRK